MPSGWVVRIARIVPPENAVQVLYTSKPEPTELGAIVVALCEAPLRRYGEAAQCVAAFFFKLGAPRDVWDPGPSDRPQHG